MPLPRTLAFLCLAALAAPSAAGSLPAETRVLRGERFWIGPPEALARLEAGLAPLPGAVALRERLPDDARTVLRAPHVRLVAPLRKLLGRSHPALGRALDEGGALRDALGAEALVAMPCSGGVTLVHESTAAPASAWLAAWALHALLGAL